MKTESKKVGVWMDHSKACFVDLNPNPTMAGITYSEAEEQERINGESSEGVRLGNNRFTNNEHHRHNRKTDLMQKYFKNISTRLRDYDDILLFGSSKAKEELFNLLKSDRHFAEKKINLKTSTHLTENQMLAEVRQFFEVTE
jgi:hypothetical protein